MRVPVETDEEKAASQSAKTQKMSTEMVELRRLAKYVLQPDTVTYKPIITLIPDVVCQRLRYNVPVTCTMLHQPQASKTHNYNFCNAPIIPE